MSYESLLPRGVEPRKLAERGVRLEGDIKVDALENLMSYLVNDQAHTLVHVDLQFDTDEQRLRVVTGNARAKVQMACQRCLEPVEVVLEAGFNLAIAPDEEKAKQLPRSYDPLIVPYEGDLDLWSVVEEELILTLPSVPMHNDCEVETSFGELDQAAEQTDKPNPFSVLAQLKSKR